MADDAVAASPSPSPPSRHPSLLREDCWSEESTHALIEAWGSHHLALNRGNLTQSHWRQVATAVNSSSERRRQPRTDVQCKNRIDTLKKKYKVEKSKTAHSDGAYVSPWPLFSRLDFLISGASGGGGGGKDGAKRLITSSPPMTPALTNFPVGPRSVKHRKRAEVADDSFFRQHFAAVIAAAAEVEKRERDSPGTSSSGGGGNSRRKEERKGGFETGCQQLAEAIVRFGEVYERVEAVKQEQLIELEKHRMQFAKDLECQRMKLLIETQLQLARIKRPKHSDDADNYL